MKTEPSYDIVEMIDDDVDLWGNRLTDGTSDDAGGRFRWAGPAAAAALIAIVGYGVISSAIQTDPNVSPAAPGVISTQYYVANAPPGFALYAAEDRDGAGALASDFADNGPAQLWATVDASGTHGSWFVVSEGTHHATGRNAYRTLVDDIEVVIEREPSSRLSRVSFTKNGVPIEITALGWADRQLVRLVRAVNVDPTAVWFSDNFFETDHKRILDADPALALLGSPVARVEYRSGADVTADHFTITVADNNLVDRPTVEKFALGPAGTFSVREDTAVVGQSVVDPDLSIVQWHDDDRLITISGNVDAQFLQSIAPTVHLTSRDDVRDQLAALSGSVTPAQPTRETIGADSLADGSWWSVEVSPLGAADTNAGYLWWISRLSDSIRRYEPRASLPSGGPTIETFVENGTAYVLAKVPRSMLGAELHVNPTGLPSIVVPFLDVDAKLPDLFAAVAVVEPVPFAAQIVDGFGRQAAFWPS
jgi:hypothetical protein